MDPNQIIAVCVFVGVMALVVSEKVHRAVAALVGAMIVLLTGVITFDQGMAAIDFNTIGVLCGMMLFVAVIKTCGIFEFIAIKSAKLAKGNPWLIMVYFFIVTVLLSALLDNVTTVLLIGPMTLMVCKILDLDPVPFFISEIMAANIGGMATNVGDPSTMMISSNAGLSFFDFLAVNGPVIVIITIAILIVFRFLFGRKMKTTKEEREHVMELDEHDAIKDPRLFKISVVMIILIALAFSLHGTLGIKSSVVALTAAAIVLLLSKFNLEVAIKDVEWSTIGFFLGLFIVVGALNDTGVIDMLATGIINITGGNPMLMMIVILWASALLSSILDNIPFVATVIPIILALQATGVDVYPLWWALALGACLGGNGTIVGASANIVLSSISAREGYPITFAHYFKIGYPVMIMATLISTVYLLLVFFV